MMYKTYNNHKLLFDTDLIFCKNPKANGTHLPYWVFVEGTMGDAKFRVWPKKIRHPASLFCLVYFCTEHVYVIWIRSCEIIEMAAYFQN